MKDPRKEAVKKKNIYQFSDEAIRTHLGISGDLNEVLKKELIKPKTVLSVDTLKGTIEIRNKALADLKGFVNHFTGDKYDMYIAAEHYLDTKEMRRRMRIVDKGRTDWSDYAEPSIDWTAPELTNEQELTRLLFLATIAKKLMVPDIAQKLITFMPRTAKNLLTKNHVTRIASGNIVSQDARILELVAEVTSETSIVIRAAFRTFSTKEIELIEEDFLSTHLPLFDLDTIAEPLRKESEDPVFTSDSETIYKPESFLWEEIPRDPYYLMSRRYDGIELWFNSVWAVSQKGYPYENSEDTAEHLYISNDGYLWAILVDNREYPLEKPFYTDKVLLKEIVLRREEAERIRFCRDVNRFFYHMDKACLKDAIEKKDLSLLQKRECFLSPENIEECILFAKSMNASECLTWLDSRFAAVMAAKNEFAEEPYGYLEELKDNRSWLAWAETWMNTYDDLLENEPAIQFEGKKFVTSGIYRDSAAIEKAIIAKGGVMRSQISGITDYLVVDPRQAGESKSDAVRKKKKEGKPIKLILVQDLQKTLGLKSDEEAAKEKEFLYGLISDEKKAELKKRAEPIEEEEYDWNPDDDLDFDE